MVNPRIRIVKLKKSPGASALIASFSISSWDPDRTSDCGWSPNVPRAAQQPRTDAWDTRGYSSGRYGNRKPDRSAWNLFWISRLWYWWSDKNFPDYPNSPNPPNYPFVKTTIRGARFWSESRSRTYRCLGPRRRLFLRVSPSPSNSAAHLAAASAKPIPEFFSFFRAALPPPRRR